MTCPLRAYTLFWRYLRLAYLLETSQMCWLFEGLPCHYKQISYIVNVIWKVVSSAYKRVKSLSDTLARSLMRIKKSKGPRTEPWGTPVCSIIFCHLCVCISNDSQTNGLPHLETRNVSIGGCVKSFRPMNIKRMKSGSLFFRLS